jgi:HAD superfamily hydrolase (TIGR01509 family)
MQISRGPQAVIFDMDGVIIDSEPLHEEAQRVVFARHGIEVPVSVYSDFKGQTEQDVFQFVVREYGNSSHDPAVLVSEKHAAYERLIDEMEPVAGALEFIEFLSHRSYRLALTTSAIRANQQRAFDRFGLGSYFHVVVTAEDVGRPKPDPQPYLITASRMQLAPANCLVIEDSLNGVRSALAAGCRVAALTTSFTADELRSAGANVVHESFDDLRGDFARSQPPLPGNSR